MRAALKTSLCAAGLSLLPAFSAMAEEKSVLEHLREEGELYAYQVQTIGNFCAEMNNEVIPVLNELDLRQSFSADFHESEVECEIRYGDDLVQTISGHQVYSLNRGADTARVADAIMQSLDHDDRMKVAEGLPHLINGL
jgi:hypothetical protein